MKNFIEKIWKDGFLDEHSIIAPKISNLNDQNSINLVDNFQRKYRINMIALSCAAVIVAAIFIALSMSVLGVFVGMAFAAHALMGRRRYNLVKAIDKTANSSEFLKDFRAWLEITEKEMILVSQITLPAMALVLAVQVRYFEPFKGKVDGWIAANPDLTLLFGAPAWAVALTIVAAAILFFASPVLYRFDMKANYGQDIKRLDENLADIHALKQ